MISNVNNQLQSCRQYSHLDKKKGQNRHTNTKIEISGGYGEGRKIRNNPKNKNRESGQLFFRKKKRYVGRDADCVTFQCEKK